MNGFNKTEPQLDASRLVFSRHLDAICVCDDRNFFDQDRQQKDARWYAARKCAQPGQG
jgi:hypothetical protein